MHWTEYFLNIAEEVKKKSKDNHTQIGVVIVGKNNEIVTTGYNSFPRGINDNVVERQERPEKYYWFEHAERNAIYNAALIGTSTDGCRMYMTCGIPCTDCTRAIINAGIKEINCVRSGGSNEDVWKEHAKRSLEMFKEAGVKIYMYERTDDGEDWKRYPHSILEVVDTYNVPPDGW